MINVKHSKIVFEERFVITMNVFFSEVCQWPTSISFPLFQENGFSYRETSVLAANERWGLSFAQQDEPGWVHL